MGTSQSALALLFGLSFTGGFFWGLFADLCAVLGGDPPPSSVPEIGAWISSHGMSADSKGRIGRAFAKIDLFLRDLVFCIVGAVFLILLLYDVNRGVFRSFGIVCMGIGYGVYRSTLHRFLVRTLLWGRAFLYVMIVKTIRPLCRPFKWFFTKCLRPPFLRLIGRVRMGTARLRARRTLRRERRGQVPEDKNETVAKKAKIKGEEDEKTAFSFKNGYADRARNVCCSSHRIRPE